MRGGYRRAVQEEEEESAFVSMTDMTVSFLFIIMILLAFFISNFSSEDNVPRVQFLDMRDQRDEMRDQRDRVEREKEALETKLRSAEDERDRALKEIERLQALLEARDEQISDLKEQIKQQQERIARLELEIVELERRLKEMDKRDPLEAYLTRAAAARLRILEKLRDQIRLDFPDLLIEISAESDALRFQGEGLFDVGKSELADRPRRIVETIAARLDEILPCYTLGRVSDFKSGCNSSAALIEAVQIEGHTDAQGPDLSNLRLSTDRANATFAAMVSDRPELTAHLNFRYQPVLSVAGYGEMRPVKTNETVEGRSTNRRIDLRIILYTPTVTQEIDTIRKRLADPLPESAR